jgi:sulfatase modifying factor 1
MRHAFFSHALVCAAYFVAPLAASADVFNMPAGQTSLLTVPVGNQGNANDPNTGNVYGGVSYSYSIGEYDVTVGQYTAFLNAVAATDTYGVYRGSGAIAQSGSPGSYMYNVIGSPNQPIASVDWFDAARFSNWLYNNQPKGPEGPGTTETGSYSLNGSDSFTVKRNANATWVIPTESEWYKAAYYNPNTSSYYQYPLSSNAKPQSAMPGSAPNTGNFLDYTTGYAVTGSTNYNQNQNYLTDVGAYTASASPYGAFDMGGDVFQWNESSSGSNDQWGYRGGCWQLDSSNSASSQRNYFAGVQISPYIGFRVALVPEPASFILLSLASVGLLLRCRR